MVICTRTSLPSLPSMHHHGKAMRLYVSAVHATLLPSRRIPCPGHQSYDGCNARKRDAELPVARSCDPAAARDARLYSAEMYLSTEGDGG